MSDLPAQPKGGYRRLENLFIFLFLAACIVLILVNPVQPGTAGLASVESPEVEAYASAMPNQGWAPLTVYFSAYGSSASGSRIASIEWDLDGNGRYDTDATADGGYTSYNYIKPGTYLVSLRVTDESGRFAVDQVVVEARYPNSSSVDYWTVFDNSQVRRVEIRLTQSAWQELWADVEAKTTIPVDANIFGETMEMVGFRMRGQFSLRESRDKKPFKIDTDTYLVDQEYQNLRQLMFINNIGDASLLQEKLAYDMMHFAGIPSSFASFVQLWFDFTDDDQPPVFWGVYTMIERVDNKFLGNRFGRDSKNGNLYKASHAQRGPMDLIYYGELITDYPSQNGQYAYGKMNNEEAADYSDIIQLCRVIDGVTYATPEDFAAAAEEVINVDAFIRYMAVTNILGNWDSYPYTGNNFYLFYNSITGRFEWIPWDLSWGGNPQHPLFGLEGPGIVKGAPLFDNVFQVRRYRIQYAAYIDLLQRVWFNPDHMYGEITRYHNLIAPLIRQGQGDRMFFGENAMMPVETFDQSWEGLVRFVQERSTFIRSELDSQLSQDFPPFPSRVPEMIE